jgi:hypothetical protein
MYHTVLLYVFFVLLYAFFVLFYVFFCVVLCDVCFVTFPILFVCIYVLNNCHRVATQLQLNICININIYQVSGEQERCCFPPPILLTRSCTCRLLSLPQFQIFLKRAAFSNSRRNSVYSDKGA